MKRLRIMLAALVALVLGGCGGDSIQSPDFTRQLQGLVISPQTTAPLALGATRDFTAAARYTVPPGSGAEFETVPLTSGVTWSSSNNNVVTIDSSGRATAVSEGAATITGRFEGQSGTAEVVVGPAQLQFLSIAPLNPVVAVGRTLQLTANGTFTDGQVRPVEATWAISGSDATIDAGPGLTTTVTGVSRGGGTVTATSTADPSIFATANLTVRARVVTLTIIPDNSPLTPAGRPFQFHATGTIQTGPSQTETGSTNNGTLAGVVWSIANQLGDSNPAPVANIDSALGIATGLRVGAADVRAEVDELSDTAVFNVAPAVLESVVISPDGPVTLNVGTVRELTATGVYSDNSTAPVSASWTLQSSSVPGIVSFDPNPAAATSVSGLVQGTGTLRASVVVNQGQPNESTLFDEAAVTVSAATLESIVRIDPSSASVNPGRSVEFRVLGRFSGGTEAFVDDSRVTWGSSNNAIATIAGDGFATGVAEGQVTITATVTGVAGQATATLNVTESQCTTPLLSSDGAQVSQQVNGLCLGCSLQNGANIIDGLPLTFGTLVAPVQLSNDAFVGARVTAAATGAPYTVPFAGGNDAGFVIGRPTGLLAVQLLDRLEVSTLRNGVVQETWRGRTELSLDLLGVQLDLLGNSSDVGLVKIQTSLPYDAIQVSIPGGAAQVLDDLRVFQACGTVAAPVQPELVGLTRVAPISTTLVSGLTQNFVAYGRLPDGTEVEIADADLIWSSANEDVATVDQNGLVTAGQAGGPVAITARLKDSVASGSGSRTAVANVTVVARACTTSFGDLNAQVTDAKGVLCLGNALCSTSNLPAAADGQLLTSADVNIPLGLLGVLGGLGANVAVSVQMPFGSTPIAAGDFTGFVLGRPVNPLLQLELLDSIQISTLRRNALGVTQVVETRRAAVVGSTPLRLGLLGLDVIGENQLVLAGFRTTQPYDGIRVTFNSGVASVLSNFKVFESCATAVEPAAQ